MKLVVCLIVFGDHKTFKYKFENFFNDSNINYIIHYNKRDYLEFEKIKKINLFQQKNIYLFSEIEVFWGDVSILDVELCCIKKANEIFGDYENLIILDGKSLPCRNWQYIMNKIETFNGNWFNFNNMKYPKWAYYWKIFERQEFYSNLISILKKPKNYTKGSWWLLKVAKKNFKKNINNEIKNKKFFKWSFLYINYYLLFTLFKKKNIKYLQYFISPLNKVSKNELMKLNIIGPNIIISKQKINKILEYDYRKNEYNKLLLIHGPEEIYFNNLYKKVFNKFEIENSNNAFLMFPKKHIINNKRFRALIENDDNLLFIRRFETIKKMKKFKKNIFID